MSHSLPPSSVNAPQVREQRPSSAGLFHLLSEVMNDVIPVRYLTKNSCN